MPKPRDRRFGHPLRYAAVALPLIGCASLKNAEPRPPLEKPRELPAAAPALPGQQSVRVSQFVFLADFELNAEQPIFTELSNLREQVVRDLQLPTATVPIQVYLFPDRDKYERFMKHRYPDLPRRRAFFVAQPRTVGGSDELMVYTFWGDRIRQDLRHELTHAILHSVLKDVPLWLDEGLAEYYELPPEADGVNRQHLTQLLDGTFKPDLARLESLTEVRQMTPVEYREAWAWVHLMLRGSPPGRAVLLAYLKQLRTTAHPGPLTPRLSPAVPELSESLQTHLLQQARAQVAKFDGNE